MVTPRSYDEAWWGNEPGTWDLIAVPHYRSLRPANGTRHTWEDDARNRAARRATPEVAECREPLSCRGWAVKSDAPCEAAAHAGSVFCARHATIGAPGDVRRARRVSPLDPDEAKLAQVSTRAQRMALHNPAGGAYSQVLRRQLLAAAERNRDPELRAEVALDLEAMNAVDPDDAAVLLADIAQVEMALLARITRRHAQGAMSVAEYASAVMNLGEHARKILATRSAILGTSADELEGEVSRALEAMGLGGDGSAPTAADRAIQIEIDTPTQEDIDGALLGSGGQLDRPQDHAV